MHGISYTIVSSIAIICLLKLILADKELRKQLANGSPLVGHVVKTGSGKDVHEYLGIPFAEPPIDDLRFKKPVPKKPWTHVHAATKRSRGCTQTLDTYFGEFKGSMMWNANTGVSEDCLYLNIWAPKKDAQSPNLSVMVWIFGGGYWSGTSTLDLYDGGIMATEQNVVVISMNYRVSAFGFLYLDSEDAPGNMGLWDQLEALKWIREHISVFGGDPDEVTLFSESSGSASVSAHLLSPHSRSYFTRAIMQSGSIIAPWALEAKETLVKRVLLLSEACGCGVTIRDPTPDFKKAIICLREQPAEIIRQNEWVTTEFCDFPWTPVTDGDFLPEDPIELLKRGDFKKADILLGNNKNEANYFLVYHATDVFPQDSFFEEEEFIRDDALYRATARVLLEPEFRTNPIVFNAILHEYRDYTIPKTAFKLQEAVDQMLGDFNFVCNVIEFAQYFKEQQRRVYMFYFLHRSSYTYWPKWMGVLHGYEIPFIFGQPLDNRFNYTVEEKHLARRMMSYWVNFARTGDPNKNPDGTTVDGDPWPQYTLANEEHFTLDTSQVHPSVIHGPRRRYCEFWRHYLPKLFAATKDISYIEIRWKMEFEKWQTNYMRDWKYQIERYSRHQEKFANGVSSCGGR